MMYFYYFIGVNYFMVIEVILKANIPTMGKLESCGLAVQLKVVKVARDNRRPN